MNKTTTTIALLMLMISAEVLCAQHRNDRPNILFVISDQWRRQALGFTNQDPVITPHLDRFAQEAVYFEHAVTNRPICAPSRATIFTGQYPQTHGVFGNKVRLSTQSHTLGDIAKAEGYHTAYIGKLHLDGQDEGFVPKERRHGFDYWITSRHHVPFNQGYYIQNRTEAQVIKDTWEPDWITDQSIHYLDSIKGEPFCLVMSYGPPHTGGGKGFEDRNQPGKRFKGKIKHGYGYAAPEKWEKLYADPESLPRRENVRPVGKAKDESWPVLPGYFGAISSIDENFGRMVSYLKAHDRFDNTIIIFTSDHGEMLGSHGRMTKGIWYDESLGIPCLISYKDKVQSGVVSNPFSTVDMTPTLLGLAGIEIPASMDGSNFAPAIMGKAQELPDTAFCSFDQGTPSERDRAWRAVYTARYTYVLAKELYKADKVINGAVLYDRRKDPYQLNPIYTGMGYDPEIKQLHQALLNHLKDTNDPFIELQWKTDNKPKYTYSDARMK
ncbi:sulfatase family protein [Aestuariivivens sediminicola]|uniref:sulfatase family protein n=1 Tax=Aestuariivivens sediminicola TaxID=2913560 RepID=UPI001F59912B|nr:sulfatase [Aestuariivivens sediminicola]